MGACISGGWFVRVDFWRVRRWLLWATMIEGRRLTMNRRECRTTEPGRPGSTQDEDFFFLLFLIFRNSRNNESQDKYNKDGEQEKEQSTRSFELSRIIAQQTNHSSSVQKWWVLVEYIPSRSINAGGSSSKKKRMLLDPLFRRQQRIYLYIFGVCARTFPLRAS